MRYILIILVFLSVGANAQMVIKAHANYRPFAAPVSANLLLDDYPNAAAAYSLRKLDKDYTGACMRIRRSDNSAESDIGFVNNYLDTTAIKNFTGSGATAFISVWYDQSGNGRNASQSVAADQPAIMVNNFEFVLMSPGLVNQKGISFSTGSRRLIANFTTISQPISAFVYARKNNATTAAAGVIYDSYNNTSSALYYTGTSEATNNRWALSSGLSLQGTTAGNTNPNLFSTLHNGASSSIHINGQSYVSGNAGTNGLNGLAIGNLRGNPSPIVGGYILEGRIGELIVYPSNQSSNRTGIENNINDYYNIYWNGDFTGLLDTYGSSAAAYSLRNLSSTYTGPLIRVRKDTTGQPEMDIYGDYYGNLDTVGLKNFLQTRSGFVTTWYSQGDSTSVNFAQSTQANQPRIALNGVIERRAGKPSVFFDGSNDFMQVASSTSKFNFLHRAAPSQISAVAQFGTGSNPNNYYVLLDNNGTSQGTRGIAFWYDDRAFVPRNDMIVFLTSTNVTNLFANNYCTPNEVKLLSYLQTGGSGIVKGGKLYLNGGNAQTATNPFGSSGETGNASHNMTMGRTANTSDGPMLGYISEIVMWSVDNTSNRTGIENNINAYYSIY